MLVDAVEPSLGSAGYPMSKNHPDARRGMMTFVITIFVVAIVVAAIYVFGFTPGEP
jgi:hypothetical protein